MAGRSGKKSSWLRRLMVFLNILAVLALIASYAALWTDPRVFWPLAFAGLAYPVILVINVFFILLWLVTWKRVIFLSLVTVLAGWTQLMTLKPVHLSGPDESQAGTVRVMTYNIHGFNYPNPNHDITQRKVLGFIKKQQPQLLCFQEFTPRGGESIQTVGDSLGLPYYFHKNYANYRNPDAVSGITVFSASPILQSGFLRDDRNRVFAIWADIRHDGQTLRIYNCHLVSARLGAKDYSFYEDLKNQETEKLDLREGVFSIFRKLKKAFMLRSEQTEKLLGSVSKSPYPVILAGDLNDSPFSYCYHQLSRKMKDSYREAGTGWLGNTFAGQLPSYRIDYIFHDKRLNAVSYKKYEEGFSDHYPISAALSWTD